VLDHRRFHVIARPGFNASAGATLQAEAISWWRAEIASLSLAMTPIIFTVVKY